MKKKKYINIFKKEDGAGLVLALMVLMVLAVLGVAVAGVTIGSHKLGNINRDSNSAYYIAEAGANLAYEEIKSEVMKVYSEATNGSIYFDELQKYMAKFSKAYKDFSTQFGDNPIATVTIVKENPTDNNDHKYIIVSEGKIGGTLRTVRKPLEVFWKETKTGGGGGIGLPRMPNGAVIMAGDGLKFGNHATIIGDVYVKGERNLGKFVHTDDKGIRRTDSSDGFLDDFDLEPFESIIESFPTFPDRTKLGAGKITNNTVQESIYRPKYTTKGPLKFDTNGDTIDFVVDNLTVKHNITVNGGGTVNIFVKDEIKFEGNKLEINKGGTPIKFNILYKGEKPIKINNHFVFNGTFFIEQATMEINNHLTIEGIILSFKEEKEEGSLKEEGVAFNANTHEEIIGTIYAPHATFKSHTQLNFKGGLVAKHVDVHNHANFTYKEIEYLKDYPFGDEYDDPDGSGPGSGGGEGGNTPGGETSLDQLIVAGPALEP